MSVFSSIDEFLSQNKSWRWAKDFWKNRGWKPTAIFLINRAPNITFPFEFKKIETVVVNESSMEVDQATVKEVTNNKNKSEKVTILRWEKAYDATVKDCQERLGNLGEQNPIGCWKVVWWRELFHVLGGAIVSFIPTLALYLPLSYFLNDPWWLLVWAVPLLVGGVILYIELTGDAKKEGVSFKNFLDTFMWGIGASLLPMVLTLFEWV